MTNTPEIRKLSFLLESSVRQQIAAVSDHRVATETSGQVAEEVVAAMLDRLHIVRAAPRFPNDGCAYFALSGDADSFMSYISAHFTRETSGWSVPTQDTWSVRLSATTDAAFQEELNSRTEQLDRWINGFNEEWAQVRKHLVAVANKCARSRQEAAAAIHQQAAIIARLGLNDVCAVERNAADDNVK